MIDLVDILTRHEGLKLRPYMDCCGKYWRECPCGFKGKLTIGIGRNLEDVGLTESEAQYLRENDVGRVRMGLDGALPWWRALDETRQLVLLCMTFQMGLGGVLKFEKFLHALAHGDYQKAAGEMMDSLWAKQAPRRAKELAALMQMPADA